MSASSSQDEIPPPPPSTIITNTQPTKLSYSVTIKLPYLKKEGLPQRAMKGSRLLSQLEIHGAVYLQRMQIKYFYFSTFCIGVFEVYKRLYRIHLKPQNVAFVSETPAVLMELLLKLDHEDLDQLDECDLEEMDLKWQVAMISMRMIKVLLDDWRVMHGIWKQGWSRTGQRRILGLLVTIDGRVQFVTLAVQTRTGNNPVNTVKASGTNYVSTARQNINKQTVLTSTALKVNTVKPSVNDVRPQNAFNKTHSLSSRPLKGTTVLRTKLTNQKIYIAKENPHRTLKNKGIIDSGCSRHMTGNKTYLADYQDINGGPVAFGGSRGYITGKGKIQTGKLDFEDVSFVKELQHFNLFSVSQMCDKMNKVLFTDTECLILSPDFKLPDENQILLKVPRQNNMYSFNLENIVPLGGLACLIAKATSDESNLWHRRLGHVNFKNLNRLVKGNLVRGLPTKLFQNDHTCVACQKGKQHKASCKAKLVSSISHTLQLLHMDLFGPTSVRSINHKTYCLVITDDFSRFSWTFFLRTKDETSAILKDFIRQIENQLNQKVKTIRCDNGTEFKNRDIIEFCGLKGIKREYSNARTPQQNGVAERKNRTLIEAARTMLADSFLPNTFWAEAVSTACYVLNRVLVTKPHNKTPYELLTGKTPIISYIRPFGCHVTILNTIDHLGKFAGKSDEGFLVGYSLQSKAFRVYNLETKRVEENLHINFLENKPNVAGKGPTWLFDLDYLTDSMNYHSVRSENQANLHAGQQESNQNTGTKDKIVAGDSEKEDEFDQDCFELPIWNSYSSTNSSASKSDNKKGGPREEEQVFLDDLARLQRQEKEANEEAEALRKNLEQETENLVTQAGAAKSSSTNIFSTVSTTAKASGTNFVNTVSIPVSTASPNKGLSLSDTTNSQEDDSEIPLLKDIHEDTTDGIFTHSSYDDEGAEADFTNLETVVNVSPIPTSRINPSHPSVLILGDPTSAVQTRSKVNKSSEAHAFVSYVQKQRRNNHKDFHHCLFACFLSQHEPKKISKALEDESWVDAMQEELLQFEIQKVWILVDLPYGKKAIGTKWVYQNKKDERGVVVRNKARLVAQGHRQEEGIDYDEIDEEFEALMKSRFQMSSMGELTFFLGLQVKQKPDGIFISQDKYVAEILKKFNFASVKTASTPIETQKPLVKDEEASDVDVHLYRSMIGSLMYVTASRPDIMFAVCACSRFQVTPKTSHLSAVKRIFRYLKGKPKLGLWYPRVSSFDLESYSDSDYAGANLDRKSTTGGCQFLGRRLITWQCKKQTIVATSTTEAEYVAAASCCGQVLWIQNQIGSSVDERGKTHHGKSNLFQETPKPLCSTFLPTDVKHCLNVGYTFVNFTTSEAVWKSHVCITRKSWLLFKSKKIAQVVHAWIQSKNSLVKHFEDMRLCRPSKEYLQVWFDPPRDESMSCLTTKGMRNNGAMCARESLKRVTDGTEAFLILTLFILCLDKVSTDHAKLVPLGKVCTAKETLEKNTAKGTKCKLEPLISLTDDLSLLSNMAALESCPKHNMIAYLEKTEGNVEFHEVIDFLRRSYIYHALTVSPVVSTTFVEQFWTSAKSKTINNVRHITAKVAGKFVSISEASIRTDLIFDDADGIDSLPNQAIFDAIQLMGYEGDLTIQAKEIIILKAQSPSSRRQAKPVINISKAISEDCLIAAKTPREELLLERNLGCTISLITLITLETENAQSEGRTREMVDEDKEIDEVRLSTEDVVSTDKEGVSTDFEKSKEKVLKIKVESTVGHNRSYTYPQHESSKAASKEKEKGVELKDVEEIDRPRPTSTRSLLTLKPLPKIDPKDKEKKKIEEEDESESEDDDIPQAVKKFKQLESDEELARKIQEEWEKIPPRRESEENTRKEKAPVQKKMKSRKRRFKQDTSQDDPSDSEKENDELRLCLTIAPDEDKEVDYEILDKKYPIIDWKTENLGTKPQIDESKRSEEINY
ncbi:putative ribonuclease H-like domain-containing protein [Tanacetum coccineum]